MAKFPMKTLLLLRRGAYTVASENVKVLSSVMRKVSPKTASKEVVKETFWMRDPKTGNWIPETHFDDVDVAELRDKFLSKKKDKI